MYVTPRPQAEDDPLFAVRLASAAALGFLIAVVLQSPMPMLTPALTVGMMAGMRKRFDAKKAFGGPNQRHGNTVCSGALPYSQNRQPYRYANSYCHRTNVSNGHELPHCDGAYA